MANHAPDRTGLARYYTRRHIEAEVAVRWAIARLSRRHDLPPAKALTALAEAVHSRGISKRTLQRYWQADITAFREALRERYQSPAARRRIRMHEALAKGMLPVAATPLQIGFNRSSVSGKSGKKARK